MGEEQAAKTPQTEALDAQHRELVAVVDKLVRRDGERALKAELSLLLRQLLFLTEHHFNEEEAYMSSTGYCRLDTHQIMHRQLLATLRERVTEFEAGDGRLGTRLTTFLKFWLLAHINGMDKDLIRRASPSPASTLRPARRPSR